MDQPPLQDKHKPKWDIKYERLQERFKNPYWAHLVFGVLLLFGASFFVESFDLPRVTKIILIFLIVILFESLIFGIIERQKRIPYRINKIMERTQISFDTTNYIKSIKYLEKIIRIDERYVYAWYNKGAVLYKLGRNEDAIECYEKVIEIDDTFADAWYNNACLESLRNNKQESIKYLKKAIELDEIYREKARIDPDFDNIRNSEEFKELIG